MKNLIFLILMLSSLAATAQQPAIKQYGDSAGYYFDSSYGKYPVTIDLEATDFVEYAVTYWKPGGRNKRDELLWRNRDDGRTANTFRVWLEWHRIKNECWWQYFKNIKTE